MPTVVYANTTIPVPTYDSGIVQLPSAATLLPAVLVSTGLGLMGAHFFNDSAAQILVTLTDGSDGILYKDYPVAAGQPWDADFGLLPVTGLKWKASAAVNVWGKVWGFLR